MALASFDSIETEKSPAQDSAPKASRPRWLRRLVYAILILAFLAAAWTGLAGWWMPRFVQPRLEAEATEALGTPVKLDRIEFAPWSLAARLHGLQVGPQAMPWVHIDEVHADLSLESVWRLAPVLDRLEILRPKLRIEREQADRFNFAPAIERIRSRPSSSGEPARFALNNIRLSEGSVLYADRVLEREYHVDALELGVPFLSNLPSQVTIDVEPLLSARIDGSPLHMKGRTQPFSDGQRSEITVRWEAVDLAHWSRALRPLLPPSAQVAVEKGTLETDLHLSFERRTNAPQPLLQVQGGVKVRDMDAALPGLRWQWAALTIAGIDLRPLERHASVSDVSVEQVAADVNLAAMSSKPAKLARPAKTPSAVPEWAWSVGKIDVQGRHASLKVDTGSAPWALASWHVLATGIDSKPGAAPVALLVEAQDPQRGQLRVESQVRVQPQHAKGKLAFEGIDLAKYIPPVQDALPLRWRWREGALKAEAQFEWDPKALRIDGGEVQVQGAHIVPAEAPGPASNDRATLGQISAHGLRAQLAFDGSEGPLVEIGSIETDRLDVRATRLENGEWALQPTKAVVSTLEGEKKTEEGKSLRWSVGALSCKSCVLAIADHTMKPAVEAGLRNLDLKTGEFSSDWTRRTSFEMNAQLQRGGSMRLAGDVQPEPLSLRTRIGLKAVDLRPIQPYVDPYANVTLVSGKVDAEGELQADTGTAGIAARYRGSLGLTDWRTLDKVNQAEFLRWKRLALDGMNLVWRAGALQLDLGQVALSDFYGRLIIQPDGHINLRDIKREQGEDSRSLTTAKGAQASSPAPATPTPPAAAPNAAPAVSGGPAAQLRWRGIKLDNGRIDFTDNFIRPNYSARLTQLEGEISAVAWNDPQPASVRLHGRVDASAPLEITGEIHPLGPRLYTDLRAVAKGIELTRLSAYSGRYAGYAIEKGTLSMDVRYKVDGGKLEAENKIFLDQLTFGERVESPDALKVPVLLAVSLLKNSRGEIDVNLPISGSLDDPEFSIGGIIVRVIVNLIVKAVSAPFTLLASSFGSAGQELGYVEFEAGSNQLGDDARQKLDTLVKALNDRPALKLEATGRADPAVDIEGLRHAYVARQMRAAKARATGVSPANLAIEPQERDKWLEEAYKAADIKKPRNVVGLTKSLPPAEMEALLMAAAPVEEEQLRNLANRRADNVKEYLVGKVAPERVQLTASKLDAAGIDDKGKTTRVQFALK